jgi:hypothetical protein
MLSKEWKRRKPATKSAFTKPGFLITFERFQFCVIFGFADAFGSKVPGFANARTVKGKLKTKLLNA